VEAENPHHLPAMLLLDPLDFCYMLVSGMLSTVQTSWLVRAEQRGTTGGDETPTSYAYHLDWQYPSSGTVPFQEVLHPSTSLRAAA